MTGLPGQTGELLEADIKKALARSPGHVSLYSLSVEETSPLMRRLEQGRIALPDPDSADSLWLSGRDLLEASGFTQYEVSNFCLPGKESVHNLRYWRMENWLGFGPGASGTVFFDEPFPARKDGILALRRTLPHDIDAYLEGTLAPQEEELDRDTLLKESLLMGFRSVYGPDRTLFKKRFGLAVEDAIPKTFRKWRRLGQNSPGGTYIREEGPALTREGLLFLNRFLEDAFAELG
jgi:oxygen-independent coproporphyrinogen-3 oxidase